MSDSNNTKRALASALKELMAEMPFEKINIANICEKCGMNRKSFYYHFKDKYDLLNWIFDTEFISMTAKKEFRNSWDFLQEMCDYLGENRDFYRRALRVKGQNSFAEHFMEFLQPIIEKHMREIFGNSMSEFHVLFFTDALVSSVRRWLTEMKDTDSREFVALLKSIIQVSAVRLNEEMEEEEEEKEKKERSQHSA